MKWTSKPNFLSQKILDNDLFAIHKRKVTLFTDTDNLMYNIKTEDVYEDFSKKKEIFKFKNYSAESKYDDSNKVVVWKMKDETGGAPIKEFVGLKSKMYPFLVDDCSEHKRAKGVNRNVDATINHGEYKDVELNKKCFMNRIQSKDHKIGTYEISKISLSCYDDKSISKTMDMID